ncbi:MAG: RNase adapter RapZ [Succinivibrionaceae bacterium]|nr:RNase adapter RapZ [Succinivibrionaceae bacterium]
MDRQPVELIIITGRSGSGKTVALRGLEDLGFYCIDNLPVALLGALFEHATADYPKLAVSIDIRNLPTPRHVAQLEKHYLAIKDDPRFLMTVIYVDAQDDVLIKRYSETRRVHPLSRANLPLNEAIRAEASLLSSLSAYADLRIDTSAMSIHDFNRKIATLVRRSPTHALIVVVESFGFKNGIAPDADLVFDTRFLPNPFWESELRGYNGLEQPIVDFFKRHPEVDEYEQDIERLVLKWLPAVEQSHRSYLTIAIGCTGGYHRSVYIAQRLGEALQASGRLVQIRHNSLDRNHQA